MNWKKAVLIFGAFGLVVCAALAMWLWPEWEAKTERSAEGPIVARSNEQARNLQIVAWASNAQIEPGAPIRVSVGLTNRSRRPIRKITLEVTHPSGWTADPPPALPPLFKPLADGESILLREFTLKPTRSSLGKSRVSILVTWVDSTDQTSANYVLLGPIKVGSRSRADTQRVILAAIRLFRDLALPGVLAYIAYDLKRRDKKRQQERQAREQKEERKRADIARERSRIQETWTLMLPVTHRYTGEFYMPLVSAVRNLSAEIEKVHGVGRPGCRRCLFRLLSLMRQVRAISLPPIGGIFLRNLKAEDIVAIAWSHFRKKASLYLNEGSLEIALGRMKPRDDYPTFEKRWAGQPRVKAAFDRLLLDFSNWAGGDILDDVKVMQVSSQVLEIEINQLHRYWYDGKVDFPEEEVRNTRASVVGLGLDRVVELLDLIQALGAYIESKAESGKESLDALLKTPAQAGGET